MMNRQAVRRFIRRVHWLPVLVMALCSAAIIWVVVDNAGYSQALVLIGAAIALALLSRGDK